MKILSSFLLGAVLAVSAPLFPDTVNDGIPLDPASPYLGRNIYVIPGSVFYVGIEDCGYCDPPPCDCNDGLVYGRMSPVSAGFVNVEIGYFGGLSAWLADNTIHYDPLSITLTHASPYASFLLPFASESETLILTLRNAVQGIERASGTEYAWVYQTGPTAGTPEPGTMALGGLALLAISWRWKRGQIA